MDTQKISDFAIALRKHLCLSPLHWSIIMAITDTQSVDYYREEADALFEKLRLDGKN